MSYFISKTFSQQQVDWFLFWIIFIAESWFRNFTILKNNFAENRLGKKRGGWWKMTSSRGVGKIDGGGRGWKSRILDDVICERSLRPQKRKYRILKFQILHFLMIFGRVNIFKIRYFHFWGLNLKSAWSNFLIASALFWRIFGYR